ncbi:hypothetical protein GSI_01746 [Ganoderma sinense ZZ0214-1]|uniref:Uncharacterized protein n=1 Tax=Ganoderma sinense ZZ0214-1 TaxID=1077348 RepID=A0A2G8SQP1_9APHY|nr:hypothetical protein GSI_01746 [Ganoderma sinense ZZ0214-1]
MQQLSSVTSEDVAISGGASTSNALDDPDTPISQEIEVDDENSLNAGGPRTISDQLQTAVEGEDNPFALPDLVQEYLDRHFAASLQDANNLKATLNPHGTAYTWVLRVHIVQAIFMQLQIGAGQTEAHSNTVKLDGTPVTIECNHIFKWLSINKSTFDTNQSYVRKFKTVWTKMSGDREAWNGIDKASLCFDVLDAYFRDNEVLPTHQTLPPDITHGKQHAVDVAMRSLRVLCTQIATALD